MSENEDSNFDLKNQEIVALSAIYSDDFKLITDEDKKEFNIRLTSSEFEDDFNGLNINFNLRHKAVLVIRFSLPESYPVNSPPIFFFSETKNLNQSHLSEIEILVKDSVFT